MLSKITRSLYKAYLFFSPDDKVILVRHLGLYLALGSFLTYDIRDKRGALKCDDGGGQSAVVC